ncbi:hypothetical protein ACFLS1_07115 [Verrucomicrobiota bacterium]
MKQGLRSLIVVLTTTLFLVVSPVTAVQFSDFGPNGEGGYLNNQTFTISENGKVFELDAFLNIEGLDLNGIDKGTSAQLSKHSIPLGYTFFATTSPDSIDAILTYTFTNNTASTISNIQFFFYLDAEIDEHANTFFNEYAETEGALGKNSKDPDPDSWHVNEPGYTFGNILDNLLDGSLDNSNAVPDLLPDDVSMTIAFDLGILKPGKSVHVDILISENHTVTGSFALVHHDRDPASQTEITLSGQAHVPVYEFFFNGDVEGKGVLNIADGWYPEGTSITVTAAADFGWYFDHWSGDVPVGSEADNPVTVIMNKNQNVTAHFIKDTTPPQLTVPADMTLEYPPDMSPDATGWATSSEARVLSSFGGHYYEFVGGTNITWNEAKQEAEEKGGYLAVVTNVPENTFIASNILARSWIGGTDEAEECKRRFKNAAGAGRKVRHLNL